MVAQDLETTSPDDEESRRGLGLLPWIVLAIVALVVLWLLRGYAFGPAVEPGTVSTATTTVNVSDLTKPQTPPASSVSSSETTQVSRVPDVVGLFESEAQSAIERDGFEISVTSVYSTSEPVGMVFDQVPGAFEEAEPGSVVAVLVSVGPAPTATVTVPDLVGLKIATAQNRAQARGLDPKLMIQPIAASPGRVYQQSPKAGAKVAEGSKVFILAGEASGY